MWNQISLQVVTKYESPENINYLEKDRTTAWFYEVMQRMQSI